MSCGIRPPKEHGRRHSAYAPGSSRPRGQKRHERNSSTGSTIHQVPATCWSMSAVLGLAICAGPLWLWWVPLRWYRLKLDDFVYLGSRSFPR